MSECLSVGLTGGIASGKSAVSRRMAELGAVVIDADVVARDVLARGSEGLAEVVEAFGEEVLAADGSLDRPALGQIVFADETARQRLNSIVHPRVRAESARLREAAPAGSVVVEDLPLLVETGQQENFDVVVVVDTTVEEQLRRLSRRDGMTSTEARQRVAAQADRWERLAAATHVIDSSGPVAETMRQVAALWRDICRMADETTKA